METIMSVSPSVQHYLEDTQIDFSTVKHGFSETAYDTACAARISVATMIKTVVLRDRLDGHYVLAIIPANHKLKLSWVNNILGSNLILAREMELSELFPDCCLGAVPATGQPYGIKVVWDNALQLQRDLYFEAGDHEELIHLQQAQFDQLFEAQTHDVISVPVESYSLYHSDEMRSSFT
jgi:Ala-tRNA(Pro) deacylase